MVTVFRKKDEYCKMTHDNDNHFLSLFTAMLYLDTKDTPFTWSCSIVQKTTFSK